MNNIMLYLKKMKKNHKIMIISLLFSVYSIIRNNTGGIECGKL